MDNDLLYLLRDPAALNCSLYLTFTYIVASILQESGRQPVISFFILFGTSDCKTIIITLIVILVIITMAQSRAL